MTFRKFAPVFFLLLAGTLFPFMSHAQTASDLAGSYQIEGGEGYEEDGMFHQFYLHADGTFYLAAEWEQFETSRFAGTWHVAGDWVELSGQANVQTSHGSWVTEFTRSFRISQANGVWVLTPNPLKNRFGMMGWPNAFVFVTAQYEPNIDHANIPATVQAIPAAIQALR